MPTASKLSSSVRTAWAPRFALIVSLWAPAPLGFAQTAPTRFDTYESRLEMLALTQTLNAGILASSSATQSLEKWCRDHKMADDPIIVARVTAGIDKVRPREITFRDSDAFKSRTLTLRQLKDARFFFHNGSFTSVKDVVRHFNAGVPQNAQAAAAGTLTHRFSSPRGRRAPRGLGLSDEQVDDLTVFIENALYHPGFVHFDPDSPTDTIKLNERDLLGSPKRVIRLSRARCFRDSGCSTTPPRCLVSTTGQYR